MLRMVADRLAFRSPASSGVLGSLRACRRQEAWTGRMRLHVRADGAEAVRGNDAEPAGPSKRARQNARRRERQKDKTARLETKKSRERQQSLTDELQGIRPEPVAPVAPLSGFRVVRRSVIDAALPCLGCAGKFVVSCSRCVGTGRLSVGGWHVKNNINRLKLAVRAPPHLQRCCSGSKWTSIEKTLGYDFFTATSTRKHEGAASGRVSWLVEMAAAGDPSVRLWVPEEVVADRSAWIAGWKEGIWQVPSGAPRLQWLRDRESVTCPHCGGLGQVPCPECSGVDRPAAAMV